MAITFHTQECGYKLKDRRRIAALMRRCAESEGYRTGDVAVVFCCDEYMLELNNRYLGHNYHTDIITFDYGGAAGDEPGAWPTASGDLFIGVDTVADNAVVGGVAAEEEMRRVIIHGMLHLCGYGDKSDGEAKVMRAKEDFYLALFPEV